MPEGGRPMESSKEVAQVHNAVHVTACPASPCSYADHLQSNASKALPCSMHVPKVLTNAGCVEVEKPAGGC
jgi:hypothetical protein